MARPRKCRKVCRLPINNHFVAVNGNKRKVVVMTVDEYESIRLIDGEGFSQEQCSEYMKIARTTAQQIYLSARQKLAQMLVEGCSLIIKGGDYNLCDGSEGNCGCGGCRKHKNKCLKTNSLEE